MKHSGSMITTPPGGMKPSGTGSPKGTATPVRGNKGGFNPANPGAGAGTKAPSATPKLTRLGFWFWRDLEFEAELRAWCYHKPQSPYSSSSLDGSNPACEPMGIAGRLLDQNRSMLGFRRHRDFED